MRKLLMSSTCLLWAFSANAADNAVTVTNGADINLKSKDLGAGLQLMQHGILDTAGNEILGLLTASPAATSISGRLVTINTSLSTINTTLGTPFQAGGSIGNTTFASTQGTSPWIIAGPAASGAALSGNPVRIGLSDGTNAVNWLTSSAISDGATGTGMAAVGNHVWNGTTWDRMPGTTAGLTVLSPVAANFLTTATLSAETTKIIGTVNIAAGQSITVTQGTASNLNVQASNAGTFAVQLTGATNNINNISGTITLPTLAATSTKQSDGTQKTQIVDGAGAVIASTSNNLNVQCANCSGSGVSTADAASFTPSVSLFAGGGGFFQTTATSNALTTGQQGMFQVTANRALFSNLRNAAGTEIGTSTTPLQVSVANTAANGTAMLVTGTGGTFPVTATNLSTNVAQIAGSTSSTGNGTSDAGTLRVAVASNNTAFSVNATLSTETTKIIGTVRNLGNAGAITDFIGQNATTPANAWLVGCGFNTTPTTITTGNSSPLQCDSGGKLLVTATVTAANLSTNVAQMNGVTVSMNNGLSGTGVQRVLLASDSTAISTAGYMSVKIDQTTAGTTNAISLAQINATTTLAGNGATGTGAQRVTIADNNTLPTGWASSVGIASTTSGQTGPLVQCAVTTSSPTYANAQTDPLSCDTTGGLRTNPGTAASWGIGATGSGVPANAQLAGFSDGTNMVVPKVGAVANIASAAGIVQSLAVGQYNATPTTVTDTRYQSLQTDVNGFLKVNIAAGASAGGTSSTFGATFPLTGTASGYTDGNNMIAGRAGTVLNATGATAANFIDALNVAQYNSAPLALTDGRYNSAQITVGGNLKQRPGSDWGTITTWTTATSVNTNLVVSCGDSAPTVLIDIVGSGTITLGVISFQYANDATDCSGTTGTFANLPTSAVNQQYPLLAGTNPLTLTTGQTAVALSTRGTRVIRARLTTAITGSGGQVIISPTVSSVNPLLDALINPLATGSNIIGKVGIDQTTPGTTNNVTVISLTAPVSTMNSASASSGVNSAMAGVFDDSSPTAITENNFGFLRMSANRNLYGTIRDAAGNERGVNVNANNALSAAIDQTTPGTTNGVSAVAAAIGGASTTGNIAANNTTAVVIKASAGTLYGAQLYGLGSAPAYLKIYNATSATCGSGTPVKRLMIPAASTAANGAGSNISFGDVGIAFGTGITYCIVTGIADNDATAPAAATFLVNLDWK